MGLVPILENKISFEIEVEIVDDRLIDFIEKSQRYLKEKQDELKKVEKKAEAYLQDKLLNEIQMGKNVSIHTRVKKPKSLGEKIVRKKVLGDADIQPEEFIDTLKDIIGIRLVCLLNEEEHDLYEEIENAFHVETDMTNFSKMTDACESEGYLAINHSGQPEIQKNQKEIFKMQCYWVEEETKTPIELQLKSLVHMFWGELEHKLIYKNYSYDQHQGFYQEIMNSISELLTNIDGQLTTINLHLSKKGEEEQKKIRAREILATEMYINLQEKLNGLLIDNEIDFREVYNVLSEIVIQQKAYDKVIEILSNMIGKLKDINIRKEDFIFTEEQLRIGREAHLKPLGEVIKSFILSTDIMWRTVFGLYHKIENNTDIKHSYKEFVGKLDIIHQSTDDTTDDLTTGLPFDHDVISEVIEPIIDKGLVKALHDYKNIDFFISENEVSIALRGFLKTLSSHIDDFNQEIIMNASEKKEYVIELLSTKLKFHILLNISGNINMDEIREFKKEFSSNVLWVFDFNFDEIDKIIRKNNLTLQDKEKLIILLTKLDKEEGEQDD
jgi:ppGpp synthetase/RelA/SpoT-type nucleotidyltranferase